MQEILNSIRNRPRFKLETTVNPEDFKIMMRKHMELRKKKLGGVVSTGRAIIRLRKSKNEYWAPQLQLRCEWDEEDKIHYIRGLFGPRPTIWTLFIFLYGLGACIVLIPGMYGLVQMMLKQPAPWLWANALGLFIIAVTYVASFIGRRIAAGHMSVLRQFVEHVFREENILRETGINATN